MRRELKLLIDESLSGRVAHLLVAALEQVSDDLATGAIVVLTRDRARIRRLPI